MGRLGKLSWAGAGANQTAANSHAAVIAPRRFVIARPALPAALNAAACGQDADNPLAGQAWPQPELAGFRDGMVIAATPITTQPRPIHAVGDSVSPSNSTPSTTPIGTRR